ncbi:7896_t:CDS:2 [Acaulospora morrowiae]|uniref:7896_t:CDS:1 n=1 Tax=Acaulospora morrowiae TaxID=94023 RepID=A0A9N9DHF7_9GLOM|nr:7896_t:CDS:2 [Acaulospora morrowiae]
MSDASRKVKEVTKALQDTVGVGASTTSPPRYTPTTPSLQCHQHYHRTFLNVLLMFTRQVSKFIGCLGS